MEMHNQNSFKFVDERLNRRLLTLLRKSEVKHSIDKQGVIHYSATVADAVENDLICSIRDEAFPQWQVLTCPPDWIGSYREYMSGHGILFYEELSDGELWFLLPRRFRPHQWKLECPANADRIAI
jgi:hypothetical protein